MSNTTKIIIALVAVVVIAVGAVLLSGNRAGDGGTANAPGTSNNGSELADDEVAATITYTDSGFSPASVTVTSGSAVRIVNESNDDLGPSSDPHPDHTTNPELNFPDIAPGQSATVVVVEKGTWGYHNHFKDDHRATIIVE